eukprot:6759228-Alexandrium_andersonii.AAC.1
MSASLVGSEMCIRDRLEAARGRVNCSSMGVDVAAGCLQRPGRLDCAIAVSYTHLTLPTICSV